MLQSQSLCPRPTLNFAFTVRKSCPPSSVYPHSGWLYFPSCDDRCQCRLSTSITQSQFPLDRINKRVKTRMLMNSSIGILTAELNTRSHRKAAPPSNVRPQHQTQTVELPL